jgi:hypothetical protein
VTSRLGLTPPLTVHLSAVQVQWAMAQGRAAQAEVPVGGPSYTGMSGNAETHGAGTVGELAAAEALTRLHHLLVTHHLTPGPADLSVTARGRGRVWTIDVKTAGKPHYLKIAYPERQVIRADLLMGVRLDRCSERQGAKVSIWGVVSSIDAARWPLEQPRTGGNLVRAAWLSTLTPIADWAW